jgi:4'-phosphopantetheinyl transferase
MRLDPAAIHVWLADLNAAAAAWPQLANLLSDDEQGRARRFLHEDDRRRFVTARGLLRSLLGGVLGIGGDQVRFRYGPHGKPELAEPHLPFRFNLSHSGHLALYALAFGREVGVDVERMNASKDILPLAQRFFSPLETRLLEGAGPRRRELFFKLWTMKEACVKADGAGLFWSLRGVVPAVQPDRRSAWVDGRDARAKWFVRSLRLAPGYAAAVAAEGERWRMRRHDWSFMGRTASRRAAA